MTSTSTRPQTRREGTSEGADGLDGAAMATDDLGDVILGNGHLDRRGVLAIDNLEAHGVDIVYDVDDKVLHKIGDTIGEKLLISGVSGLEIR